MTVAAQTLPAARRSALDRCWAFARRHVLTVYAFLAFAYLLVPIGIVILFSFNNPAGRFNFTWQGFTLKNWENWDGVPGLREAITLSVEIALLSSLVATALGTLIALSLVRYRFRGRGTTNLLIFLPLDDRDCACDVLHLVRRRNGESPADRLRSASRGGGNGPRCK